ncbi:MAG: hypothetical protein ACPGR8_09130, partial [Limisphaerales bacterium]
QLGRFLITPPSCPSLCAVASALYFKKLQQKSYLRANIHLIKLVNTILNRKKALAQLYSRTRANPMKTHRT